MTQDQLQNKELTIPLEHGTGMTQDQLQEKVLGMIGEKTIMPQDIKEPWAVEQETLKPEDLAQRHISITLVKLKGKSEIIMQWNKNLLLPSTEEIMGDCRHMLWCHSGLYLWTLEMNRGIFRILEEKGAPN